jgi:hypothetical protein
MTTSHKSGPTQRKHDVYVGQHHQPVTPQLSISIASTEAHDLKLLLLNQVYIKISPDFLGSQHSPHDNHLYRGARTHKPTKNSLGATTAMMGKRNPLYAAI